MSREPSEMDKKKLPPAISLASLNDKHGGGDAPALSNAADLPTQEITHESNTSDHREDVDRRPSPAEPSLGPTTEADALREDPESGRLLAEHMADASYQPVILFGNAASGKTSLILSLLAAIKMDARLDAGLFLGSPILDTAKKYGSYLWEQASQFYGIKTQQFIEGTASPRTIIDLPFFIPLIFRPTGKPEAKIAFMESNGEWYRADREGNKFFPPLRKQIEEFITHYPGGIIFIHLLPYSQRHLYSNKNPGGSEILERSEASLAVAGALEAYNNIRPDKSADQHLILVTKWDAHRSDDGEADAIADLHDDAATVRAFVGQHYPQALAACRALRLSPTQMQMNGYCAGRIAGNEIIAVAPGDELAESLRRFPIGLWRWLYRHTLEANGLAAIDPFPAPRAGLFAWARRLLDRLF